LDFQFWEGFSTSQSWCYIGIILVCYNSEFDFQDGYVTPLHNVKMFRRITNEKMENWRQLASNSKDEWQQSNAIGSCHPSSILRELSIFKIKYWRWRVKNDPIRTDTVSVTWYLSIRLFDDEVNCNVHETLTLNNGSRRQPENFSFKIDV